MHKLERFKENLARTRYEREIAESRQAYVPPTPIEQAPPELVQHYIQPLNEYIQQNILGDCTRTRAEMQAMLDSKIHEIRNELLVHRTTTHHQINAFPPSVVLTETGFAIKLGVTIIGMIG